MSVLLDDCDVFRNHSLSYEKNALRLLLSWINCYALISCKSKLEKINTFHINIYIHIIIQIKMRAKIGKKCKLNADRIRAYQNIKSYYIILYSNTEETFV